VDSIGSILSTELHRGYFYVEGRMSPVSAPESFLGVTEQH
jgi:hypothetical protein